MLENFRDRELLEGAEREAEGPQARRAMLWHAGGTSWPREGSQEAHLCFLWPAGLEGPRLSLGPARTFREGFQVSVPKVSEPDPETTAQR